MKSILIFFGLIAMLPLSVFSQSVTVDTAFIQIFRPECCGWTGSDGTLSVALNNGKTLWGMGDSFIGEVFSDTSRPCYPESKLVNNTLLLQEGTSLTTYFNRTDTSAYIPGTDSSVMWPGHGIQIEDTIYVFFYEVKKIGLIRLSVRLVKLKATTTEILDMVTLPPMEDIAFGQYVLQEDGFIYIFGTRTTGTGFATLRTPYLARIPADQALANFAQWTFYDGAGWSSDVSGAQGLFAARETVSSTYGVIKFGGQYHLISQASFLGGKIYKWSANKINGPYTNRTTLYDTQPFRNYDGCDLFTYNAMIHPQFTNEYGLLLSFNVMPNKNDTSCSVSYCGLSCCPPCAICLNPLIFKNVDTYRPKFVRIPLCLLAEIRENTEATICAGETYILPDGAEVSEPGTYETVLQTAAGCDSIISVKLAVVSAITLADTAILGDDGASNGSISPKLTGGLLPFKYEWSTGDTTLEIRNLPAGTYTLTVTDALGCIYNFTFELPIITSTADAMNNVQLKIYPNPSKDYIYVELEQPEAFREELKLILRDINGKVLESGWEKNGNIWRLERGRMISGVYTIYAIIGNRISGAKRIIMY